MTVLRKQERTVSVPTDWLTKISMLIGELAELAGRSDADTPEPIRAKIEQLFTLADEGLDDLVADPLEAETEEDAETAEDAKHIGNKIYVGWDKNGKQKTTVGAGVGKMNFGVNITGGFPFQPIAKKEAPAAPACTSDVFFPPNAKELDKRSVRDDQVAHGKTAVAQKLAAQKALAAALGEMFEVQTSS